MRIRLMLCAFIMLCATTTLHAQKYNSPKSKPQLQNQTEITQLEDSVYSAVLQSQNLFGKAQFKVFVFADGRAAPALLMSSSGNETVDSAALLVARRMQWTAAKSDGGPVDFSVTVPIEFKRRK